MEVVEIIYRYFDFRFGVEKLGKMVREVVLAVVTLSVIIGTTFLFHMTQTFHKDFSKGEKFFKRGGYMMSLGYLIPAAQAKPQNAEVLKYLAISYDKLDRKEDVLKSLQALESIGDKDPAVREWLADAYYGNDYLAAAERIYRNILETANKPDIRRKLAEVLAWQKKYDQAEVLLVQLCKDDHRDYKSCELLADIYAWDKKYDQAIKLYKQVMSLDSKNHDVILKLADVLRYSGKDRESIRLYKQYIKSAG